MPADTLTCREFVEQTTAYLDGALDAPLLLAFEHHLDSCANCQIYLSQQRRLPRLLRFHLAEPPSTVACCRAAATFRAWQRLHR